jgi:hypothetical protein
MQKWIDAIVGIRDQNERIAEILDKELNELPIKSRSNSAAVVLKAETTRIKSVTKFEIHIPSALAKMLEYLDKHNLNSNDINSMDPTTTVNDIMLLKAIQDSDNVDKQLEKCANVAAVTKLLILYLSDSLPGPIFPNELAKQIFEQSK